MLALADTGEADSFGGVGGRTGLVVVDMAFVVLAVWFIPWWRFGVDWLFGFRSPSLSSGFAFLGESAC